MITSTGNSRVRAVRTLVKKAKARKEQGQFIVEGARMFAELPKAQLEYAFVSESFLKLLKQQGRDPDEFLKGKGCEIVSDEVMNYMSDTQTPQGILAVARQRSCTLDEILKAAKASGSGDGLKDGGAPPQLLILETIQDPGNLGTILRAGEGAGVSAVVMNGGTADIYNPKVIRSTMGSIYRVPFVYTDDLLQAVNRLKGGGVRLFAAHLNGASDYDQEDYRTACGFLIGNEAAGLSDELAEAADCCVRIPMLGQVESLNAAVAASVLMFEAARQRRQESRTAVG